MSMIVGFQISSHERDIVKEYALPYLLGYPVHVLDIPYCEFSMQFDLATDSISTIARCFDVANRIARVLRRGTYFVKCGSIVDVLQVVKGGNPSNEAMGKLAQNTTLLAGCILIEWLKLREME